MKQTGKLDPSDPRCTKLCAFCSLERLVRIGTVKYVDSEGTTYCPYCWRDALEPQLRSIRKKEALEGPKYWVNRTQYYRLKRLTKRETKDEQS